MWNDIFISFITIAAELTVLFFIISFVVNVLQGFLPFEKIEKYLFNSSKLTGATVSIILAFITPFCSCSTIPIIVGMLQKKVRFGFVMIFLFASPLLDPTIITLMGALLGWKVAIWYTIITTIFSVIIGFMLEFLGFENAVKKVIISGGKQVNNRFDVKRAISETITLMKTVFPYLIIGALIGSIIHGAVPETLITTYFGGDDWWLIPIAAIIGIPLYIRLSTMIPIAHIMVAKGMALGPVMAIMISSTGASLPEITLLNSIFHRRLVVAFLISVIIMSTLSGTLFYFIN
ncbi:MAG: permease [Bacillales bacterium]|jgi:uncharacterized membrane protein YraQ (UPF0718 family)|nr:permease [Bacillales bacterium]